MKHAKRREPLIYSEEFRAAILAAFPSSERIRLMLDENSFSLGYSLSDGAISAIDPAHVVTPGSRESRGIVKGSKGSTRKKKTL